MRYARIGSLAFTALCLALAVASLLMPYRLQFCAGGGCTATSCGSAAFPKQSIDFPDMGDAANCTGGTPARLTLYAVAAAGVGLGAIVLTSRRRPGSHPAP